MRSKWQNWRAGWKWSWITSGAAIFAIVLGWAYMQTRLPGWVASDCRAMYARARTPTDSAVVDTELVGRRAIGWGWNCGMLRRTGATDPRPVP